MAKVFRAWFSWGFWGSIIQILIIATAIPVFTLVNRDYDKIKQIVFASVQGLACCSTVLWFIMGCFWRFSTAGRTVAGEKLERTAEVSDEEWKKQLEGAHTSDGYQFYASSFMSVYLWIWIVIIMIGLTVLGLYGIKYWLESDERAKLQEMEKNDKMR